MPTPVQGLEIPEKCVAESELLDSEIPKEREQFQNADSKEQLQNSFWHNSNEDVGSKEELENDFSKKQLPLKFDASEASSGVPEHYNILDILHATFPLQLILFLGGLHQFKNKVLERIYVNCWMLCFVVCGSMCFLNLIFREKPYHNFASDLLTAYVHVPACRSYLFWQRMIHAKHGVEIADQLRKFDKTHRDLFFQRLRWGSWLAVVTMILMSGIALSGFSLPGQIAQETVEDRTSTFMYWHALTMWAPIPPVICTIFAGFALLCIFCVMHNSQLDHLRTKLARTITNTHEHNPGCFAPERDKNLDLNVDPNDPDALKQLIQEIHARNISEQEFDDLLINVRRYCIKVQQTLDESCWAWSALYFHLLLFSMAQVIVVVNNIKTHSINIGSLDYMYYWVLQDIFHCVCGASFVFLFLGLNIAVTMKAGSVRNETVKLFEDLGTANVKLTTVITLLNRNVTGASIFGEPVNLPKAFPFIFCLFLLIFHTFTQVMQVRLSSGT